MEKILNEYRKIPSESEAVNLIKYAPLPSSIISLLKVKEDGDCVFFPDDGVLKIMCYLGDAVCGTPVFLES